VHRVNTIEALELVPRAFGVEIDLRADRDRIILNHEAFAQGEDFDRWLDRGCFLSGEKLAEILARVHALDQNRATFHVFLEKFDGPATGTIPEKRSLADYLVRLERWCDLDHRGHTSIERRSCDKVVLARRKRRFHFERPPPLELADRRGEFV